MEGSPSQVAFRPTEPHSRDIEENLPKVHTRAFSEPANWWKDIVDVRYADLIFILCSFVTGLGDSFSYSLWYCFLSMHSGNTIFLGLGTASLPQNKPWGWAKSLVSISSFFVGASTFARLTRRAGARQRGTLCCSFGAQSLFILVAAALIQADLIPHDLGNEPTSGTLFLELIPISLLAAQFGGQIAASRAMGFTEIPTVVLTSLYFDVASDPNLTDGLTKNVKRNRRIGSITALLLGAIVAGWLCRSGAALGVLWICLVIKVGIAVGWLFWTRAEGPP